MSASEPRFPIIEWDVPSARAEELGAWLFELGASGIELRDETTSAKGAGPNAVTLVASFESRAAAEQAHGEVKRQHAATRCLVSEIVGDSWRDKYKEHFAPFRLTDSITVVPPWVDYQGDSEQRGDTEERVVWMDPGRVFGTGLHATTALGAVQLEQNRKRLQGVKLLDVGTGTGILALVGLLLGAREAVAIDNDPDVIDVAQGNARGNQLEERVRIDTTPLEELTESFEVVVANIRATVLLQMATSMPALVKPGGLLLLSGVLVSQRDELIGAYEASFELLRTIQRDAGADQWLAFALQRRHR